jgi:hypothetical protein
MDLFKAIINNSFYTTPFISIIELSRPKKEKSKIAET